MTVKEAKNHISNIHICQKTTSDLLAKETDQYFRDYFRMISKLLSFYEELLEEKIDNAEL